MRTSFFSIISLCLLLVGCETYTPPNFSSFTSSRTVEFSYDDTWEKLVGYSKELLEYSNAEHFIIDSLEKESGLITLSFEPSNPSRYVTGGFVEAKTAGFAGDWVDYMMLYRGASLSSKMNIIIKKVSENRTKVTVNARYTLTSLGFNMVVNTGDCISVNGALLQDSARIICPTHLPEKAIFAVF